MIDLILCNARAITLDRRQPEAELIAIKDGRIVEAGENNKLASFREGGARIIDCQGKTVVPGFNDAHCHPLAFASSLLGVDCGPTKCRDIAELQARIRRHAEWVPEGTWIRATGYNEFYLAEKRHPTCWELDEATSRHPVKLVHRSWHACVLNTTALHLAGISLETPEPEGGIIERDLETGEPNGLLFGMNDYIDRVMPSLSQEEMEQGIRAANEEYLAHGITSLQDATWSDSLKRWQIFQRLKEQGKLTCRISMMIGADALGEFQERALSTGSGNSQLRLGAVKIAPDETRGMLNPPQEELNWIAIEAHKAGFQLAIHAIEESTVKGAITALEHALEQVPQAAHRHRLEHCSVCPPPLMQRLKAIQAVIVIQPPFIYYGGERYLATVPPKQLRWLYPVGSFLKNDLRVAASSDSPVVPLNPLVGIYAAVARRAQTGQPLLPQEGVSLLDALKMYTLNAACASFEEKEKGSITPGKLADIVVLSHDLTQVPPEEIKGIEVLMTIIDGGVVWERH